MNPRIVLFLLFLAPGSFALDFFSSATQLDYNGSSVQAGALTVVVDSNDFPNASATNPVYLKFCLPPRVEIANSLVDPPTLPIIQLGTGFLEGLALDQMNTAPNAVELVRFKQGENCFYVRINQSTDQWVLAGGVSAAPPSLDRRVFFTIGISMAASVAHNTATGFGTSGNSADTQILLDLGIIHLPYFEIRLTTVTLDASTNLSGITPADGDILPITGRNVPKIGIVTFQGFPLIFKTGSVDFPTQDGVAPFLIFQNTQPEPRCAFKKP